MKRRHFTHFNIAGFTYYEGPVVFNELKIGTRLRLLSEPDNKYDPKAIAIYYDDFKLGFVPRAVNDPISKLLEMGYSNIFETVIQSINPAAQPELQVGVIVYLIPKTDNP